MVDEYQDTNTAQFELIRLLACYTDESGKIWHVKIARRLL